MSFRYGSIFGKCSFAEQDAHHQEDCTSGFAVFYNVEVVIKLYELSRYKMLSS